MRVWQEARDLAVEVYRLTGQGRLQRDFGLKDQMQRAAVSVACNISEGYERNSDADFKRFLFIAKGSLSELLTQLDIAQQIGCIDEADFAAMDKRGNKIGAMITKLVRARSKKNR
ncbi:MAG: four helix bundle protein [Desulfobacterales bacterium]